MNYKAIIRSRRLRILILSWLNWVPDKTMIGLQYRIKNHRRLNWDKPQRFTEKLQWYKLSYRDPLLPQCIDKYDVRQFVQSRGMGHTLNELYCVCRTADKLDVENLPDKFVIKKTNGGGGLRVMLCKDKSREDWKMRKEELAAWLKPSASKSGREWGYYDLEPRLVVERLLINERNPDAGVDDYKFFCFDGVPRYIVVDVDRYTDHKRNFYTADWQYLGVCSDCASFGDILQPPPVLDEMLDVAKALSVRFPFVRVDLYNDRDRVVFGEMTFYPWSGYVQFKPDSFDLDMGAFFPLRSFPAEKQHAVVETADCCVLDSNGY